MPRIVSPGLTFHQAGGVLAGAIAFAAVKNPVVQEDEDLNDSDKIITVPADTLWHILSAHLEFTTTADVGNRRIEFQIRDAADDVIFAVRAGAFQAASLSEEYAYLGGSTREPAAVQSTQVIPISQDLWLPAGFDIRIRDSFAIDADGDDLIIHMVVDEFALG